MPWTQPFPEEVVQSCLRGHWERVSRVFITETPQTALSLNGALLKTIPSGSGEVAGAGTGMSILQLNRRMPMATAWTRLPGKKDVECSWLPRLQLGKSTCE